jgi:hypothetical protein
MGRKRVKHPVRQPWNWVRAVLVLGIMAVGGMAAWWLGGPAASAPGGVPRLALDRTNIDLGRFAFDAPAKAVVTVANVGDGVLKIVDVPPVRAVQGC